MKRREERDDESKGRRSFNIEKATAEIRDNSQVKTMMSLVSCVSALPFHHLSTARNCGSTIDDISEGTIMKGKRIAKEKREEEKKGESQRALLRPFFSLHFSFTAVFCPFHTAHRLIDRG